MAWILNFGLDTEGVTDQNLSPGLEEDFCWHDSLFLSCSRAQTFDVMIGFTLESFHSDGFIWSQTEAFCLFLWEKHKANVVKALQAAWQHLPTYFDGIDGIL